MAIRPAPDHIAKQTAASIHSPRDPNTLSNYNVKTNDNVTYAFKAHISVHVGLANEAHCC